MMRNFRKKTFALGLTLALALLCALAPLAESAPCEVTPLIIINGMNAVPLFSDYGTPQARQEFPPTAAHLLGAARAVPGLARAGLHRDWSLYCDAVMPMFSNMFEGIACNPDGSPKQDIGFITFPNSFADDDRFGKVETGLDFDVALAERIGRDHTWLHIFDWRLAQTDLALELDELIRRVKQETGHAQVNVISLSLGGTVMMTYLEMFGHGDIKNLIMMSSAFQGMRMAGDLYNGRVKTDAAAITHAVTQFTKDIPVAGPAADALFCLLAESGGMDLFISAFDKLVENSAERFYSEVFAPIFGQFAGVWGGIPDGDYEDAKAFLLDEDIHKDLIEKIDYYHYRVANRTREILEAAAAEGMTLAITSHYGVAGIPIGDSCLNTHCDGIIDTAATSAGATCAPYGETLGPGYQQKIGCGHDHLSADGVIDASTCMFPEQTWFIKNMMHVDYSPEGDALELLVWLVQAREQYTVRSNAKFPQFMQLNSDLSLSPVVG